MQDIGLQHLARASSLLFAASGFAETREDASAVLLATVDLVTPGDASPPQGVTWNPQLLAVDESSSAAEMDMWSSLTLDRCVSSLISHRLHQAVCLGIRGNLSSTRENLFGSRHQRRSKATGNWHRKQR